MKKMTGRWLPAATLIAVSMLFGAGATVGTRTYATGAASPGFVRVNQCYRLTFPIAGSPNWKVLDVPGDGWIRAEVDTGATSAYREPAWINMAQVVTMREAPCSPR